MTKRPREITIGHQQGFAKPNRTNVVRNIRSDRFQPLMLESSGYPKSKPQSLQLDK